MVGIDTGDMHLMETVLTFPPGRGGANDIFFMLGCIIR